MGPVNTIRAELRAEPVKLSSRALFHFTKLQLFGINKRFTFMVFIFTDGFRAACNHSLGFHGCVRAVFMQSSLGCCIGVLAPK